MAPPAERPPRLLRMLARGLGRRCPRCGSRRVFESYWKLAERCPTCGWKFERQVGFSLGVMMINLLATSAAFLVAVGVTLALTVPDPPIALLTVVGAVTCLAFPALFYPVACTVWAAIDLAMRPLDPDEEADSITWLAVQHDAGEPS
jgi:uncharacterized protein (DUF983 family)